MAHGMTSFEILYDSQVPFLLSEEEISWKQLFAMRMSCISCADKVLSYLPEKRSGIEVHKSFLSKYAKLSEKELSLYAFLH